MGKTTRKASSSVVIGAIHNFSDKEVELFREKLLSWYDLNKRKLPWRSIAATEADVNKRAYAVWVSEIMLQQTQVAVVLKYFEKWMSKWPTVWDLATTTLEEVNRVWAGLGYYSRARRLHEAAVKVVKEMDGNFPSSRDSLIKNIPGVGKYTGGAIASIAFGNAVGVVDGNVNRVLARIRVIGSDLSNLTTIDHMWKLADELVDPNRPGDFNQAMMELGATVCTPKSPSCASCPVQDLCIAYRQEGNHKASLIASNFFLKESSESRKEKIVTDIECLPGCDLCLRKEDLDERYGVHNYPSKKLKKEVKEQVLIIILLKQTDGQMLLLKRPKLGLLANLWEFPSISCEESNEILTQHISEFFALSKSVVNSRNFVGDATHVFSHIKQTYRIYKIDLKEDKQLVSWPSTYQSGKWMSKEEFLNSATSNAMKKVKKSKRTCSDDHKDNKKQRTISHFFKAATKND
ncbi:adenine DNA glycosylase-like isoform X2 [Palaemon carinicauda]|uniref:adenine DNA glycosylase-like isoform X2 n=1 Tax=Palaemon carinicauda TaxID=392227 RepID=UPI0035B618D6